MDNKLIFNIVARNISLCKDAFNLLKNYVSPKSLFAGRKISENRERIRKNIFEKLKKDKYIFVKSHFEDEERLRERRWTLTNTSL